MSSQQSVSTATTALSSSTSTSNRNRFPKKLFLYISPTTTPSGLHLFLEQYYPIRHVHVLTNQYGQSKGMAFVTFQWHEDALSAVENLNGVTLDNMVLELQWPQPPKKSQKNKLSIQRNGSRNRSKTKGSG